MTSVNNIRSSFLTFFEKNGHEAVASSPLVPRNDPTLMFTNAGMVQFKNVFTGSEKRDYRRATTAQKCVRAGGKHNDLDNVGFTARHHTFFEMLGNFSFGDYFKEEAIELAWTLLTREWGLPADKLTATVYRDDDEAFELWKKIAGLPEERIVRLGDDSNFWQMGDTGPCGPCSEIFYDHGEQYWGGPPGSPEEDGDRFVEIWNLVFMQFQQLPDGSRVPLPKPSVDTGSGLERVAAVMQGTNNNYEIDLFRALTNAAQQVTGYSGDPANASLRVIADHLRSMSFLIAEGVLPSNEGRGYVLRRIMRRAMRHATLLGASEPVIHRIVPTLVREMGQAYPELARGEQMIEETVRLEEHRFLKTLSRGLQLLDEATTELKEGDMLEGVTAFKLYDTYGFPLDLTQDALRTRGINVDLSGFQDAMARQREEARKSWSGSGEASEDKVWFAVADKVGPTEFLGYETETAEGVVTALVKGGEMVEALEPGEEGYVILNQTPFYGESGGQVGDTGQLLGEGGVELEVLDTVKHHGVFGHRVTVTSGSVRVGSGLVLAVEHDRRSAIRANHSATHLLHEALRIVLGDHVAQRGSMVSPDRLRFDFVHTKAISPQELAEIEDIANDIVLQNSPVETRLMGVEEAKESGARALFGEKYGDEVRVVSMGDPTGNTLGWSVELCGGTHVRRTGDIGLITVLGDSGVAAGVRRIEALTAKGARRHARTNTNLVQSAADILKTVPHEVLNRIEALQDNLKKSERSLSDAQKKLALGGGTGSAAPAAETVNGTAFLGRTVEGVAARDLRGLVDQEKKKLGSGVVALVLAGEDGKGTVAIGVTDDLTARLSAAELIKHATQALGGQGGGGRPDMAQGGGPDGTKAEEAIAAVRAAL